MRTRHLVATGLLAIAAMGAGWRIAQTRGSRAARQPGTTQSAAVTEAELPRESSLKSPTEGSATAARAGEENESERRLGPFTISGSDYTVVLHNKKRQPGGTQETGDTVVAMEIRDTAETIQYQRKFPYQETNSAFSDAWIVDAGILAGTNGTGLLVSYSFDTEPSAPQEWYPDWWQVFGVVDGKLKAFRAPVYFEGQVGWEAGAKTEIYRSAGPLGPRADALQFRIWTGHFRMIYPVRVDWAEGKMTPAQACDEEAEKGGAGEVAACQYKVLPEPARQIGNTTFVTLCARPGEKCEEPEKVVVKTNSKVELLMAQVKARWIGGVATGPSGKSGKGMDAMDDAGGAGWAQNDELWLKVRIDGKEGWMHGEEDFNAFGLPHEQ